MRASTLLFLALFGGLAWVHHARGGRVRSPCAPCASSGAHVSVDHVDDAARAAAREYERAYERTSLRCRELDRSIGALDGALRTLRDAVRRPGGDAIRAELEAVESGREELVAAKQRSEAERALLQAKIQLARAGLLDAAPPRAAAAGPVDALGQVELAGRRLTSRAR